jgi:HPt (histidine-containing phosphotransfer) domain-containing protein
MPRTPIVALTADVAGSSAAWQEAGMDAYLSKPFTIRALAECLARFAPAAGRSVAASGDAPPPVEARRAAPAEAALDADVVGSLRELAGGNEAILTKIMAAFRDHAPPRMASLEDALGRGDLAATALEAHALKSPSRNVGALRLAELCAAVEQQARAGEPVGAAALDEIRGEFARVLVAVDAIIGGKADDAPGNALAAAAA